MAEASGAAIAGGRRRWRLRAIVEAPAFSYAVTTIIVVNAITLGLETSAEVMSRFGGLLVAVDRLALVLFTVELTLKIAVYRSAFFRGGWNLFDFLIVAIGWVPNAGPLTVLRALRILRVIRLVTVVPQLRRVVGALFQALPGMGAILAVLALLFYIAAVMATKLFSAEFPQWFGSIGASMFSLFQIMTLESWSMGIVRPVMDVYSYAWAFFVPFIVLTSFTVLNLFIALIVNSMQALQEKERAATRQDFELAHDERERLQASIDTLAQELKRLRSGLQGS